MIDFLELADDATENIFSDGSILTRSHCLRAMHKLLRKVEVQ